MPTLMAIGAGVGLLSGGGNAISNAVHASNQNKLNANRAAIAPWTGQAPGQTAVANPFGDVASGLGSGAAMGQALGNAGNQSALQKAMTAWYNQQAANGVPIPSTGMPGMNAAMPTEALASPWGMGVTLPGSLA